MEKTNVMRVLESKKIKYEAYDYSETGCTVGEEIARMLGQNSLQVFKTLVTVGKTGKNHFRWLYGVGKGSSGFG